MQRDSEEGQIFRNSLYPLWFVSWYSFAFKISHFWHPPDLETSHVDLSQFEQLEEVELQLSLLNQTTYQAERALKTIVAQVQKITLNVIPSHWILPSHQIDVSIWSSLDETLLEMANRLDGTGKKLEVVFCLQRPLMVSEVHKLISLLLKNWKTKPEIKFDYE